MHDSIYRFKARRPIVCVYSLVVEILADGVPGVKHGVAAFVIQLFECYNNAGSSCCRSLTSDT